MMKHVLGLFMVLSLVVITACGGGTQMTANSTKEATTSAAQAAEDPKADWPEVLRLGVLPGEEEGKMSRGNQKFVDDLGAALGIKTELFVGDDYTAVIEAMRTKKIDIASFGPFSYIIANERSGALPLAVKATSKEAAYYHSLVVVPKDSSAEKIEDLKGKTFLFADPASTSGHLFPRAKIIETLGITNDEVETYFSNVSFSGGHDKSILAIAKGTADGAGVCDSCVQRVVDAGLIKQDDFKVIAKSDPIPSSPLTYRSDLPADLVEEIKAFIFEYHKQNSEFFKEGTQQYFPVEDNDYQVVRDTAKALNMSPEELLK
ncbi:phosphonate ABC transporter substrate-binding protein [Paenibacillus alkalitolerans]|uniref:phosphonate ABC transporter substrate-binding protein n=1 Tax=Paenibacillus alkalitolerans TaxID=2799335 RepID=UPI001F171CBE|nr:phosphonate ABC transporter substrate-binding protein [Paenibacillus alkalitolerans]